MGCFVGGWKCAAVSRGVGFLGWETGVGAAVSQGLSRVQIAGWMRAHEHDGCIAGSAQKRALYFIYDLCGAMTNKAIPAETSRKIAPDRG